MDRRDYFYRQLVQEDELDEGFDGAENADRNMMVDFAHVGISWGLGVTEHSPQGVSVDVAAGAAYDQDGQRMSVPSLQNVDLTNDYLGQPTAVVGVGNSKIVGLYLKFDRSLGDPRLDGNSLTVYFDRDESYEFVVRQGSEAVTPTPPSLQSDEILLADITRTYGDITIANADIDVLDRRQDFLTLVDGATAIVRTGDVETGIQAVIDYFSGSSGAGSIDFAGAGTWGDGTGPIAALNVEDAINEIVTTVGAVTGALKIGAGVAATWADGGAVSGTNVDAVLEGIPTTLADNAAEATTGARKIGLYTDNTWENGEYLNTGGSPFAGNMLNGIGSIINDLAQSGGTPGADRVGAAAYGGTSVTLVVGSIDEQLAQLADELAGLGADNIFTGENTFDTPLITLTTEASWGISLQQRGGDGTNNGTTLTFKAAQGQDNSPGAAGDGGDIDCFIGAPGGGTTDGLPGKFMRRFSNTSDVAKVVHGQWASPGVVNATTSGNDYCKVAMSDDDVVHVKCVLLGQDSGGDEIVHTRRASFEKTSSVVSIQGETEVSKDEFGTTPDFNAVLTNDGTAGFMISVSATGATATVAIWVEWWICNLP